MSASLYNMSRLLFEELLNKYLVENITRQENIQFFSMLDEPEYQELLREQIGKDFLENTYTGTENLESRERMKKKLAALKREDKKPAPLLRLNWGRIAAAAAVLLLVSTGAYFLLRNNSIGPIAKTEMQQSRFKNDVAPGGNKAILTLDNGTQIILDSAANGTLTQQGNTKVIKLDSGQLAYQQLATGNEPISYNTVSTPKGGQYQIILSDGSKVWLNAASSLKYPTAFTGKERNVELTGEGYFEVAHNAAKPFHVSIASSLGDGRDMQVEVLGTHFNINAYSDESSIKTTLLQGSVKVTLRQAQGDKVQIIKPGEQASVTLSGADIIVGEADVDEAVAWKNGRFQFNNSDIKTIMRQLARWYDVDVTYEGNIPERFFTADISRNTNLSELLKVLELSKIHFTIEGKKLTVMP